MNSSKERFTAFLLVAIVLAVNTVWLWPEISTSRVDLNDNVLHFTLIDRMVRAVERGENPLDAWSPEWSFGYPVLRTYQPLAHMLTATIYFALGKAVPLMTVFIWIRFLSIALIPLSFFVAARRMQFAPLTAAAAALLAPLISTNYLYGMEYGSFTWAGSGLYTQAVATHFLLLALGSAWAAIRRGRHLIFTGALVGLTALAHLVYGYMAALSVCLLAVMPHAETPRRVRLQRLFTVGTAAAILTSFQVLPLLLDSSTINHSLWEPVWKWDSFGTGTVLKWLVTGELLDYGRLPVLTLLALGSVALCVWRWRMGKMEPAHAFVLLGAIFWISIFCGRALWGPLLALLGLSQDTHLHRVIGGAHVFLVLAAAVPLAWLWTELVERRLTAAAVLATALLLYPAARERQRHLANNAEWGLRNLAAHKAEESDLGRSLAAVQERGGRAYAGLAAGWGGKFKIGDVPYYAFLSTAHIPALSFLYHSMALTGDVMVRFDLGNPAQQRLFNVRTVIAPDDPGLKLPEFLTLRGKFGRFKVFDALGSGYFDLVDVGAAVTTTKRSFYEVNDRWLQSAWLPRGVHLLLDFPGKTSAGLPRVYPYNALPEPPTSLPPAGQVRNERQNGEIYQAELTVARPSYALFRMTFHKNWKAYVDGSPQPVAMLSPGFMGVAVSSGNHQISFHYEPERWKMALAIVGLIAIGLLVFAENQGSLARVDFRSWLPEGIGAGARGRAAIAAGLIVLALPVCLPLFTTSLVWGHDAFSYFPRVVEVHQNVTNGILLPRWAPDLGRGTGQPLFLYHPPLFYWLAEFWRLLGLQFVTGVNLACAMIVMASAVGMFFLGRLYFGVAGGFLAAAAYLYGPYFATNLYIRSALEEFAAFAFLPLALYGFGAFARHGDRRHLLLGAAAYAGLLLCHLPATMLFTPVLISFILLTAWIEKSWRVLFAQAWGFLFAIGLGACIWLPAVLERQHVNLTRATEGYGRYTGHFVYLHQLWHSPWAYGLSVEGPNDGMPFSVGWSHVLLGVGIWVVSSKLHTLRDRVLVRLFGAVAIVLCFLMLAYSAPIWKLITPLQYVQLPWRLLGGVTLSVAMLAGAFSPALERLGRARTPVLAVIFAFLIIPNLGHLHPGATQDIDPTFWTPEELARAGFETTTMGELTPRWMQTLPPYNARAATVIAGTAEVEQSARTPFSWRGTINAQSSATIQMWMAYFPGWSVRIDGRDAAVSPVATSGLLSFPVLQGNHQVEVSWGNSGPRQVGNAISAAAVLALIGMWLRWRRVTANEHSSQDLRMQSITR